MPTTDNERLMARVPIIPDDFENKQEHKEHELVMDFENNDLYVKKNGEYINITGQIKDSIKEIQDGSMVVHIVTEDTLPPVKERPTNHWYYIITKAEAFGTGEDTIIDTYIYYGVVDDSYSTDKSYILIAQQVFSGEQASVKMQVATGYTACFYVPITMTPRFTDASTGEQFTYDITDRLYALNTSTGSYVAYDVYMLHVNKTGEIQVNVDISGGDYFTISFESNMENIEGLKLPDPVEVKDGDPIGSIPDPTWSEPRYIFIGWSSNRIINNPIDPTTYKPEKDMTLFAFFEYDSSANTLEYYATYKSNSGNDIATMSIDKESNTLNISTGKVLGTFCSTSKKDVVVPAKKFDGYNTPEGQAVTEDKQQLTYMYDPIVYTITYDLDGGSFNENSTPKENYTVEDSEYIPPEPFKEGYYFDGWIPASIPEGHTGNVVFAAKWKVMTKLYPGPRLHDIFDNIGITVGKEGSYKDRVISIQMSENLPKENSGVIPVAISTTNSNALAWWVEEAKSILVYSKDDIWCDKNSSGIFKDFTNLRDISGLYYWNCEEGTNISDIFNGCELLSDVSMIDNWANGKFSDFTGAFKDTLASKAGRVPNWYRWNATVYYASINGPILLKDRNKYIPDQVLYPKSFTGYDTVSQSITIDKENGEYIFNYIPKKYNIKYNLNGGSMAITKSSYTIEDESYIPPIPVKEGYTFNRWIPEKINKGDYGDIVFTAVYTEN